MSRLIFGAAICLVCTSTVADSYNVEYGNKTFSVTVEKAYVPASYRQETLTPYVSAVSANKTGSCDVKTSEVREGVKAFVTELNGSTILLEISDDKLTKLAEVALPNDEGPCSGASIRLPESTGWMIKTQVKILPGQSVKVPVDDTDLVVRRISKDGA